MPRLAALLRRLADRLEPPVPAPWRDDGVPHFETGCSGAKITRVWVDGKPFVREWDRGLQKRTDDFASKLLKAGDVRKPASKRATKRAR